MMDRMIFEHNFLGQVSSEREPQICNAPRSRNSGRWAKRRFNMQKIGTSCDGMDLLPKHDDRAEYVFFVLLGVVRI